MTATGQTTAPAPAPALTPTLTPTPMIINLTPHAITIQQHDGEFRVLPPSGKVARAYERVSDQAAIDDGVPTIRVRLGAVTDLPEPCNSDLHWYVVSPTVAEAAYHYGRTYRDLLVPGEPQLRQYEGGCVPFSDCAQVAKFSPMIVECRPLIRWTPTRSTYAYHDALRYWASDRAEVEFGHSLDYQGLRDEHLQQVAEVAEQLLASLCPGPGDPTTDAIRAVQHAVELLEASRMLVTMRRDRDQEEASRVEG